MAKRRRLNPPSEETLQRIGANLAPSTGRAPPSALAPIAAQAADAAAASTPESSATRADAERYRTALEAGMVITALPLSRIVTDEIIRDRAVIDEAEMAELKASIRAHGLRLPIEVFAILEPTTQESEYGLISGWRRLTAMKEIFAETQDVAFAKINALIRTPDTSADAYVAMVEENEIRADLSQYERGRIAVLAAEQGAFDSYEEAVNSLYATGSKAKRSKIRSFALLHQSLGDVLRFPSHLSERQGLFVAGAVKAGQGGALRDAVTQSPAKDATAEWATLERAVKSSEAKPTTQGRPKSTPQEITLRDDITLVQERSGKGHVIRIVGDAVTDEMMAQIIKRIRKMLA